MAQAAKTKDHKTLQRWVEERGGKPATVSTTKDGDHAGILRIDFPIDGQDKNLEYISWEDFFQKFDEADLAFLHQDKTAAGETSRFFKFVNSDDE